MGRCLQVDFFVQSSICCLFTQAKDEFAEQGRRLWPSVTKGQFGNHFVACGEIAGFCTHRNPE